MTNYKKRDSSAFWTSNFFLQEKNSKKLKNMHDVLQVDANFRIHT